MIAHILGREQGGGYVRKTRVFKLANVVDTRFVFQKLYLVVKTINAERSVIKLNAKYALLRYSFFPQGDGYVRKN